jgi:hypothetical protein
MADLAAVIATIAAAASAIFAAVGLIFTGRQLQLTRKEHDEDRRVAYDGVTVTWQALEAPARAEADGTAQWLYEVAVQNPGRLPIQNITVQLTYPCDVVRIRYDGSRGRRTRVLTMRHPVLAGGERRAWLRRLRIPFDARGSLNSTYGRVEFDDVDSHSHRNQWPRVPGNRQPADVIEDDRPVKSPTTPTSVTHEGPGAPPLAAVSKPATSTEDGIGEVDTKPVNDDFDDSDAGRQQSVAYNYRAPEQEGSIPNESLRLDP